MLGLVSNQGVVNELTGRSTYLIEERVGKIPANYQVISIVHIFHFMVKNWNTNHLESKRSYRP